MPRSLPPSSRTSASTLNPAPPASFARSVKSEIITWRSSTTPTASAARCPPPTSLRPSTASSKSCGATAAATSIPKTPSSSSSVWPSPNSKPDAGAASPPPSKPPSISSTPSFSHDSRAKNESLRHKILDKCPARTAAPSSACRSPLRSMPAVPLTRESGLFFKPVQFHLQLPDLLVQLGLQFLVRSRPRLRAVGENLRRPLQQLLLPVRHQVGMNFVMRGNLLNRPLPFNRLQRNLGFPIGAVLRVRFILPPPGGSDFTP